MEKYLNNKRVLLVEDDEVDQMLLQFMISDLGGELVLEQDRDRVLEILQKEKFDLLLLDTRIDKMNALEFTRKLRNELNLTLPIIGLSGVNLQGRGIYNGLTAVIRKPLEYSKLIAALKSSFESSQLTPEPVL